VLIGSSLEARTEGVVELVPGIEGDSKGVLVEVLEGASVFIVRSEGAYGTHSGGTTSAQRFRSVHPSTKRCINSVIIHQRYQTTRCSHCLLTLSCIRVGTFFEQTMRVEELVGLDSWVYIAHALEIVDIAWRGASWDGLPAL
jgi:hypothetical protein